ncbi:MAG: hypothetical protein UHD05_03800 [Ruminococcus sp.]|nr:hypothetical protein [Ruminococcus sp.]
MSISSFICIAVVFFGAMIAVISDVFPKLKQNDNIGFRTSSALSDKKYGKKRIKSEVTAELSEELSLP